MSPLLDAFDAAAQRLIEAFSVQLEGKTERRQDPYPSGSLAFAAWVCAQHGGRTGYYRKPGPVITPRGHVCRKAADGGDTLFNARGTV